MVKTLELLSVIMPVHNAVDSVSVMLDSVLKQAYPNFELIVVDDGSSDGTAKVIEKYRASDKRIRLVSKSQNEGVSAARNTGLELAEGDYITFVDADDRIDAAMYRKLIQAIEEHGCDMAMCRILYEYSNTGIREEEVLQIREGVLTDVEYQKMVNGLVDMDQYFFGGIFRYVFRREVLEGHRFDVQISYREDLVFLVELMAARRKIYYGDFVGYHYVRSSGSAVERYKENLFEELIYVNGRIFRDAEGKDLPRRDRLYAMGVLEAVSLSISNLYRGDAPNRTFREYVRQIRGFLHVIDSIRNIKPGDCKVKYKPLLFLTRVKAYWMIHMLYRWKEGNRQKKLHR